jgi:hypothetical protein
LLRACHSGYLACLALLEQDARATLAAVPVLFAHAFGTCHKEKTYRVVETPISHHTHIGRATYSISKCRPVDDLELY